MTYNTVVTYNGDGVTTSFAIPFVYDTQSEVEVTRKDGVVSYVFTNPNTITLSAPLAIGDILTIQRNTDISAPKVSFRNGAGTTGQQLNAMVRQLLRSIQEVYDRVSRFMGLDAQNRWDAQGFRVTNVGDPVDPDDAATKGYVDVAAVSATNAATVAQLASQNASAASAAAQLDAAAAIAAAEDADDAAALAQLWASAPVNEIVDAGQYSAYHWAVQAASVVTGGGGTALATSFVPAGNLSSTNVQAALTELDTEKAPITHSHAVTEVTGLQGLLDAKANLSGAAFTGAVSGTTIRVSGASGGFLWWDRDGGSATGVWTAYAEDRIWRLSWGGQTGATAGDKLTLADDGSLGLVGKLTAAASTVDRASVTLPAGTAPTSPLTGDVWFTGTDLAIRRTGSVTGFLAFRNVATTVSAKWTFGASTTAGAMLNLTPGVAPTSPVNGDMWIDSEGLKVRVGGATQALGGAAATLLASGEITAATAVLDLALPQTFSQFVMLLTDVRGPSGGAQLGMRVSTDNGASYVSSANYVDEAGATGTMAMLTPIIDNSTTPLRIGELLINPGVFNVHNPSVLVYSQIGNTVDTQAARYNLNARITNLRLMMSSGSIQTMKYRLYGVR
jgi:hypothetical protein